MTPRIHPIWKPADSYTMTDALDAAGLLPGKTQRGRRVSCLAAGRLDTRLHMRQEYRESGLNGFWTNVDAEVRDAEITRLRYDDGRWREPLWKEQRIAGT